MERNGRIDSYVVMYYSTSNPSARQVDTVFGTEDSDRVFNRLGLPPRTSYTFEVEANNPLIRDPGANATINISTTAPQSKIILKSSEIRLIVNALCLFRLWLSSFWCAPL